MPSENIGVNKREAKRSQEVAAQTERKHRQHHRPLKVFRFIALGFLFLFFLLPETSLHGRVVKKYHSAISYFLSFDPEELSGFSACLCLSLA